MTARETIKTIIEFYSHPYQSGISGGETIVHELTRVLATLDADLEAARKEGFEAARWPHHLQPGFRYRDYAAWLASRKEQS